MSDRCAICGRPEDEHCSFVPINQPAGCVCNAREWGDPANLPPVCGTYGGTDGRCDTCEHDRACHVSVQEKVL